MANLINKLAAIRTYGCAQNESDSEKLSAMLHNMGYQLTDDLTEADVIVFNTCAVREGAEDRVFGNIGALKHQKAKKPNTIICVCGCMAEQPRVQQYIKNKHKHIDVVFGTSALLRFPQILTRALDTRERIIDVHGDENACDEDVTPMRSQILSVKVPIMYGCDNFCSYCIVPYVRGRERSRDYLAITQEISSLAIKGCKEVTLLGQNVNSYKCCELGEDAFSKLLECICKIDGIERIRFISSHPKDVSDRLLETMAAHDNICKQLHLPIQAGSDSVLKAMNRGYTATKYIKIIENARRMMPDLVVSTDIIVGYPTETSCDFDDTLAVLKKIEFDTVFSFIYSKREGTAAFNIASVISESEKKRNFDKLLEVQNEISLKKNANYVGKIEKVLITNTSKTNNSFLTGRTDGGKIVNFAGDTSKIGCMANVEIISANTWSLTGRLCSFT